MNPLARLGAAAGAAVLTLSLAAPAHAAKYVHNDAAGDVVVERCTWTTPEPPTDPEAEPTEPTDECTEGGADATFREGDITRTAIRHTARKVIIRTSYRELTRTNGFAVFVGSLRTNERVHRDVSIFFEPEFAPNGEVDVSRPNGDSVRCRVGKTVDFTANVIEVRIPRGCLSRPRWVQVSSGHIAVATTGDENNGGSTLAIDDAFTSNEARLFEMNWSPRVRRA